MFTLRDELTWHIQENMHSCLLFINNIVLVDETRIIVDCKLELWRSALVLIQGLIVMNNKIFDYTMN